MLVPLGTNWNYWNPHVLLNQVDIVKMCLNYSFISLPDYSFHSSTSSYFGKPKAVLWWMLPKLHILPDMEIQICRYICPHTISIHKNSRLSQSHIKVRNATEVSLNKVVISLLFFLSFKTCLVYQVQTSLASFFSTVTSKFLLSWEDWFTTNLHKRKHLIKKSFFESTGHASGLVWIWPCLMQCLLHY